MNREAALKIADAVLYEGYTLYPYRPSALKNRQRWSFGILYPPDYHEVRSGTERSSMHSELLLQTKGDCRLQINLRFLHLVRKPLAIPATDASSGSVEKAGTWQEGIARSIEFELNPHAQPVQRIEFSFPEEASEPQIQGISINPWQQVYGAVIVEVEKLDANLLKLRIDVSNETRVSFDPLDRESALPSALLSAHLLVTARGGAFISLLDPPEDVREYAGGCRNVGNFPVLVGLQHERDMMLCSPIILYDYPQIAPESVGDFYDATEMDEMLTLRVMTLTDPEKNEMRLAGEPARLLLERTEHTVREQLMKTHGVIRSMRPANEGRVPHKESGSE